MPSSSRSTYKSTQKYSSRKASQRFLTQWFAIGIVVMLVSATLLAAIFLRRSTESRSRASQGTATLQERLISQGVNVSASGSSADTPARNAVDGILDKPWNAGGPPPQWLELDLGQNYKLSKVRLRVNQWPAGETTHQISLGTQPNPSGVYRTITQNSQIGDWLEVQVAASIPEARYVRITTTQSPSWVSWHEAEVYALVSVGGDDQGDNSEGATTARQVRIRQGSNGGEFYDTTTNKTFALRGNDYTRMDTVTDGWGQQTQSHVLFLPGKYDRTEVRKDIRAMKAYGYNAIHTLLDSGIDGNQSGGLNSGYVSNFADFLKIAKEEKMFVTISVIGIPKAGGYYVQAPLELADLNWHFLSPDALQAKKRYFRDLIRGLKNAHAPLEMIFAWDIAGEVHFVETAAPLSWTSGTVNTIAGTYDMAIPAQKKKMIEDNMVIWVNQVRDAIVQEDPNVLTTIDFSAPIAVSGNDPRIIYTDQILRRLESSESRLDFISLSFYPDWGLNMEALLANYGFPSSRPKPIVMLETGVLNNSPIVPTNQLEYMKTWIEESCQRGVKGWFFFTWDTTELPEWRNALQNNEEFARGLAPTQFSSACLRGQL